MTFKCSACGWEAGRQFAYCQDCGERGSMLPWPPPAPALGPEISAPPLLSDVDAGAIARTPTGFRPLDAALGGGLAAGQTILLAGAPGAGKTSLLLVAADRLGGEGLYVAGEESVDQVAARIRSIGVAGRTLRIVNETDPLAIEELAERWARALLIVDSLNVLRDPALSGAPGSPSQIKACADILLRWAKRANVPLILVGHLIWADHFQGPRTIEHLVDTVAYYELGGAGVRTLTVTKSRFGPAGTVRVAPFGDIAGLMGPEDD